MVEKENNLSNKEAEDIKEKMDKIVNEEVVEQAIKNNEIEFDYDGKKYKVKKPTFEQREVINRERIRKYNEMIQDSNYLTEQQLIKIYKEKRGIDIEVKDKEYAQLEKRKLDIQLKLGKALKDKKPDKEIENYKRDITDLKSKQDIIFIEKTYLLEPSLEYQLKTYLYSYLTFIVTVRLENKEWVPVWKNYSDFMNADDELRNLTTSYALLVLRNEIKFGF